MSQNTWNGKIIRFQLPMKFGFCYLYKRKNSKLLRKQNHIKNSKQIAGIHENTSYAYTPTPMRTVQVEIKICCMIKFIFRIS